MRDYVCETIDSVPKDIDGSVPKPEANHQFNMNDTDPLNTNS